MADRQQYLKPPLIEAVLELRFGHDLSDKELTRAKDRLQRAFPAVEEMKTFQAKLEAYGAVRDLGLAGFKLTAKNGADVILLQRNTLVTSRLPPYYGWERLTEQAKENYELFEKVVGLKPIVRIGARFVNRIDVPDRLLADRHVGDLLNIKIELPDGTASSRAGFSLAINFKHAGSGLNILAQVAIGEPVLIDHTSVFVDLDCFIEEGIPTNPGQFWKLVETMRDPKDEIFESLITPEVRELFK
jgi:uncharacterized protein (TIGR04255 family)